MTDLLKNICIFLNVSSDDLLDLNIKDSYLSLNKENSQIINKIKKALILSYLFLIFILLN